MTVQGNEESAKGALPDDGATEGMEKGETGGEVEQGGGAGAAEKKAGGGDKTVALREERERRRVAEAAVERERARSETLARLLAEKRRGADRTGGGGKRPALDLSECVITEDELDQGNAKAINDKIAAAIAKAATAAAEEAARAAVAATSGVSAVDKMLGKYAIFADEDLTLRGDAQAAAIRAIEELPDGSSAAEVDEVIAGVAKRMSRYKAALERSGAAEDDLDESEVAAPVKVGAGTAAAAHLVHDGPAPGNMREASSLADKLVRKIAGRFK